MGSDVLAGVLCLVGGTAVAGSAVGAGMGSTRRAARIAFAAGALVCGVGNLVGATVLVIAGGVVGVAALAAAVAVRPRGPGPPARG